MIGNLKNYFVERAVQIPGWHTSEKIIVIESDDWGAVRMASTEAYHSFLERGYKVDECHYNKYDSLESDSDLEGLLETLESVKDAQNNPARFTINNVVANPDFYAIEKSGFQEYYWERFDETLKRYPQHNRVMELYNEGIKNKMLKPQFHGREHIGIGRWLEALQADDEKLKSAFSLNMYTVHHSGTTSGRRDFLDAFSEESSTNCEVTYERIKKGLQLFNEVWGFAPQSAIAPCYTWSARVEEELARNGVMYLQGGRTQLIPQQHINKRNAVKYHYTGQKNKSNQYYLIRNVHFEPAEKEHYDHVGNALSQIDLAFRFKKPAIIGSHRVNYIGGIQEKNRDKGLSLLKQLLKQVIKRWPNVIFLSSDELGSRIQTN